MLPTRLSMSCKSGICGPPRKDCRHQLSSLLKIASARDNQERMFCDDPAGSVHNVWMEDVHSNAFDHLWKDVNAGVNRAYAVISGRRSVPSRSRPV